MVSDEENNDTISWPSADDSWGFLHFMYNFSRTPTFAIEHRNFRSVKKCVRPLSSTACTLFKLTSKSRRVCAAALRVSPRRLVQPWLTVRRVSTVALPRAVQQDDKSEPARGMLHYSRYVQDPLSAKSSWKDTW